MKLGELFFNLGFNADTMKLKDFGKAVSDLNMTSILTAGSFGLVYEGAKALIGIADDMSLGISKFGRETGQSTTEVQKWNKMAEQMGISSGVVQNTVAGLEDSLFRMRVTGEKSNIWSMLRIDPTHTNDMFKVLTMLRERLKGMGTETQRFFLENLGISTEMLNMFKLTDQQWNDINKQAALTPGQLDKMVAYHKTLVQYSQNLNLIWADLGVSLIPILKSLMDVANSIDINILKSKEWEKILALISKSMELIAHPVKTIRELTGTEDSKQDKTFHPLFRFPWQKFNLDGTYAPSDKDMSRSSDITGPNLQPKVTVSMKTIVQTSDPNTKVTTFKEQWDKALNDAVNDRPEGSY